MALKKIKYHIFKLKEQRRHSHDFAFHPPNPNTKPGSVPSEPSPTVYTPPSDSPVPPSQIPGVGEGPGNVQFDAHNSEVNYWPVCVPLAADGVDVLILCHSISSLLHGTVHCWTYISRGLRQYGQREIVMTLRRNVQVESEGNFHTDPLHWIELIHSAAQQSRLVSEFQVTDFRAPRFLDRADIRRIVYCPPVPISNVPDRYLPGDGQWLLAVPLLEPEAEVARYYGSTRSLAHLGASERYFPYPPWFDRLRHPCIHPSEMRGSVRTQLRAADVLGCSALQRGSDLVLCIPETTADRLRAAVRAALVETDVVLLDSVLHRSADSGYLWKTGYVHAWGYTSGQSSSCMNTSFIAFSATPGNTGSGRDEMKLVEDGHMLFLTDTSWLKIRHLIEQAESGRVPLTSGENVIIQYERTIPLQVQPRPVPIPLPSPAFTPITASSPAVSPSPMVSPAIRHSLTQQPQARYSMSEEAGRPSELPGSRPPSSKSVKSSASSRHSLLHQEESVLSDDSDDRIHCNHILFLDNEATTDDVDPVLLATYAHNLAAELRPLLPMPADAPPGLEKGGRLIIEASLTDSKGTFLDNYDENQLTWSFSPPAMSQLPMDDMYVRAIAVERPTVLGKKKLKVRLGFDMLGYKGEWNMDGIHPVSVDVGGGP